MVDPRQHLIRLHEVFRQSLSKLKDHFCDTQDVVENNFSKMSTYPVKIFLEFFLVLSSMTDLIAQTFLTNVVLILHRKSSAPPVSG